MTTNYTLIPHLPTQTPTDAKPTPIYDDTYQRLILFHFPPSAGLTEHQAPYPVNIQILTGSATVTVGDDKHTMTAGSWLQLPPTLPHSIFAQTDLTMLLQIIKTNQ
ncbi:MAG TPA: cupin domain-containing protein [Anaerolineae bacterium]|nr:cupin domain-containing protein [Anaerolineae bacterium]